MIKNVLVIAAIVGGCTGLTPAQIADLAKTSSTASSPAPSSSPANSSDSMFRGATTEVIKQKALSGDLDCRDFNSKEEAQTFFINVGGPGADPNRLDHDQDGEACEVLDDATSFTPISTRPTAIPVATTLPMVTPTPAPIPTPFVYVPQNPTSTGMNCTQVSGYYRNGKWVNGYTRCN